MSIDLEHVRPIIAVILIVTLAGCSGLSGITGPTISDTEATVIDNRPVIAFEYEIDDYATAMLEAPNGEIVYETRIEPDYNSSALYLGEPRGGEYTIIIRRGGETVASKSLQFDGANPEIQLVEPDWSDNSLESVEITIQNKGDLPLKLEQGKYVVNGNEVTTDLYQNVAPGEMKTIEVTPSYGGEITITDPGTLEWSAIVETGNATISQQQQRTFKPASLEIVSVEPTWEDTTLKEVKVTVRNTGDVPTDGRLVIENNGDQLAEGNEYTVQPGETVDFAVSSYSIYEVESGGTVEFDVLVNSPSGYVSETFSREVDPAKVSVKSMSPTWENGQLTGLKFTAENSGDVEAEHPLTVTVNGETIWEGTVRIPADTESEFTVFDVSSYEDPMYIAKSGGSYEVELSIDTESGPVTKSEVTEFDGVAASMSSVDTTFFSSYGSDKEELSSVSFSVRNEGDIPIEYDAVRISIGGASRTDSRYSTAILSPGESTTEYVTLSEDIAVDPGTHQLTISLVRDGEVVVSETTTVSTD